VRIVLSFLTPLTKPRLILPEQEVWGQGRLGAGACTSEILGVGQSSNVNAITGMHYFH